MNKREEFEVKRARLRGLLDARGLRALVLQREASCAWLSCGPDDGANLSRVTGARSRVWTETEGGVVALIVTRDEVFLWAENIEFPRLTRDEFTALPFTPIVEDWRRSDLGRAITRVAGAAPVGYDLPTPAVMSRPGARHVGADVVALRASLTPRELTRYRWLCATAALVAASVCQSIEPGWREVRVHAALTHALAELGIDNAVPIVTSDERMWIDRHGLYSDATVRSYVMVVLCARKWGLTACLTRLVHFGMIPPEIAGKHAAARRIARRTLDATRPGVPLARIFAEVIVPAYEFEGFGDEVALHHQGGSTGYAGRDTRVGPTSSGFVQPEQAFAWNPSITGVKVEDTAVVREGGFEVLTCEPSWPLDESTGQALVLER